MRPPGVHPRFQSLDLLATLVAVVGSDGEVLFANAALEDALGISRRSISGALLQECFTEPVSCCKTRSRVRRVNEFAALRYDAWLKRTDARSAPGARRSSPRRKPLARSSSSLLPLEQQTRQDREERLIDQAQANKELIRNLAHEIKNPLGGIRGAAQLLELELDNKRADRIHPGHHPRGGPPAIAGGPPAGATPAPARGG